MAISIKVLALDQVASFAPARSLYKASATAAMKSAIIKSMRFTGIAGTGTVKMNLFFVPSGSTYPTNARRILPRDQLLPAGYEIVDEAELTLAPGDSIYLDSSVSGLPNPAPTGAWIDFVLCGLERDV